MIWILTIAGAFMIAMALRDIFHTLWHPGGFGTLARLVFKVSWRVTRLGSRRWQLRQLAGPWGLIGTLAAWTVLLVGGFTLIYLARMPQDFYFGSSLKPGIASDFVFSMYLSFVAVTTLGLGDIQPATPLLRLLVPIEALLGFVLLTAGISWILQLYPALIRRRALARRLTSMAGNDAEHVIETGEASIAVQHLEGVRSELAGVEMDLLQYGESYYFQEIQADVSLAAALPYVEELIDAGKRASSADVRNAAAMLADGLEAFRAQLRRRFLGDVADGRATLVAFARDHRQPVSW